MSRVFRIDVLVEPSGTWAMNVVQRLLEAARTLASDFDSDYINHYEIVLRERDDAMNQTLDLAVHQRKGGR